MPYCRAPAEAANEPLRFLAGLVICLVVVGDVAGSWQSDVGYNQLQAILGDDLPMGQGVPIAMVEAPCPANNSNCGIQGAFFPDTSNPEYAAQDDPFGSAVSWTNGSTGPGIPSPAESSSHASVVVGRRFFGNTLSLAPGANDVTVFEANDYINDKLGFQGNKVPYTPTTVVQNHSYVGLPVDDSSDLPVLRRLDYVIDTHDVTMSVGINNNCNAPTNGDCVAGSPNPAKAHPNLFAYSYNAIAVGTTNATHSRGATDSLYGPGRFRPDIVAPRTATSETTAIVSSAATILHEELTGTAGAKSETMRAILLAGATKEEFANFVEPSTSVANPWERTATQPLDDIFGAGELNVYNSYLMTQGGQFAGGTVAPTTVGAYGWDYQPSINPGTDVLYDFVVPVGSTAKQLSIVLAWNVEIVDTPGAGFVPDDLPLANLDLELVDSVGTTIQESISTNYPLEHIYLTDLPSGAYTLKVSTDTVRDYGLAWRMTNMFDTPSADFDGNGISDGADFLIWQRGYGQLLGATHSMGDADGDGDVDSDDLMIFQANYGQVTTSALSFAGAVPEPASILLVGTGLISLSLLQRSRSPRRS